MIFSEIKINDGLFFKERNDMNIKKGVNQDDSER